MSASLPKNPIVVIPARLGSTRLPRKPLLDIAGAPMIVQVWRRACEADIGPVLIASADREIVEVVEQAGGAAVMTDPQHPSGSDRIAEAMRHRDPASRHDAVINVQGDLPTLDPQALRAALQLLDAPDIAIATLAAEIVRDEERANPNVVKLAAAFGKGRRARALYFSRATIPARAGPHYHHIGLYAYRRAALERFVALPPGILEQRESLEQLRALENGMRIEAALVETVPLGVDTPEDLERARVLLGADRGAR